MPSGDKLDTIFICYLFRERFWILQFWRGQEFLTRRKPEKNSQELSCSGENSAVAGDYWIKFGDADIRVFIDTQSREIFMNVRDDN